MSRTSSLPDTTALHVAENSFSPVTFTVIECSPAGNGESKTRSNTSPLAKHGVSGPSRHRIIGIVYGKDLRTWTDESREVSLSLAIDIRVLRL
jgi:hypothetical protein